MVSSRASIRWPAHVLCFLWSTLACDGGTVAPACTGKCGASDAAAQAEAGPSSGPDDGGDGARDDASTQVPPEQDGSAPGPGPGLGADRDAASSGGPDSGSGSTDPGDFFGAPRCPQADVALCDDFEAEPIGSAPNPAIWAVETWGSGRAVIDDAHAARGSRAVHIESPSGGGKVFITQRETFPAPGNRLFGRMFLYIDKIPRPFRGNDSANYPLVHWTAAAATGPFMNGGSTEHPEVRAIGGINQALLINVDGGGKPEQGMGDEAPPGHESILEKQWMCFEFEYSGEGEGAELRVWWDGVEHERMHLMNKPDLEGGLWPIPKYEAMSFGWATYQDYRQIIPDGYDVWIDAVAVDYERIGCQR